MFSRDISSTTRHSNRRRPASGRKSRRSFSHTADRTRVENARVPSMRGGRRL